MVALAPLQRPFGSKPPSSQSGIYFRPLVPPAHGLVKRPRLVAKLDESMERPLTLVVADGGFGKTTLLEQWSHETRRPTAFATMSERDGDIGRFLRVVRNALVDRGSASATVEEILEAFATRAGETGSFALILDEYDRVTSDDAHAALGSIVDRLPQGARIVLACRAEPPLPLARLRGKGGLSLVRERDLRMTREEAIAFLNHHQGLGLPIAQIERLHAGTVGWVAGLRMAAIALRGASDANGFLATFGQRDKLLVEELLETLQPNVRKFLARISILKIVTSPIAEAVSSEPRAAQILASLKQQRAFVSEIAPGQFRVHRIVGEFCRARLERDEANSIPSLHALAATQLEAAGDYVAAIEHALAAGDSAYAARLLAAHGHALVDADEPNNARVLLAQLPPSEVAARPTLRLLSERLDAAKTVTRAPGERILTDREVGVLRLLAAGFSRREIAGRLLLSEETVKTHARRIFRKLIARDRAEAIAIARSKNIL